tara:strand:- start:1197 stop:1772 length:576 start_codon:yes stop_codon:yes gene_type:complete
LSFLIFTVGGSSASLFGIFQNKATQEDVSDIKEISQQGASSKLIHVTPGDFKFDLLSMRDTDNQTHVYSVILNVVAKKGDLYLKKKAVVEGFNLNDIYFSYTEYERNFKLVNISFEKSNLKNKHDSIDVILFFDPEFIFVRPVDVVYNAERLDEHKVGNISVRLFFDYEEKENSILVEIPVVFSSSHKKLL